MLAHHDSHGSFGRTNACSSPKFFSLDQLQFPLGSPTTYQQTIKPHKLRKSPLIVSAYRPSSVPGTTRSKKAIRPKREPSSPDMSGHGAQYSSSNQGNYPYATAYQSAVPQYTQTQINQYYAQYQCYPPQPYHVIADYYAQPATVAQTGYQQTVAGASYDATHWQGQVDNLELPVSQGPTRSNSRTRTWTCDIPSCTSSANFTRLADLQRHQSTVHGVGTPDYPCTVPRCNRVGDKGFTRRDHLVEHLRNFHHIDIPKRRPGERSAFPFGYPEGFQSQGAASGSDREVSRSGDRGRVVKPSKRGGRASGRGRGGSRAAGLGRSASEAQELHTHTIQQQPQERGRPRVREHESDTRTGDLDPSGLGLADAFLSFGDLSNTSSHRDTYSEDLDPWDLA
ncbi:Nn.00g014400.m01.CDS01 [Neocucurbitaria sp. VM-36]